VLVVCLDQEDGVGQAPATRLGTQRRPSRSSATARVPGPWSWPIRANCALRSVPDIARRPVGSATQAPTGPRRGLRADGERPAPREPLAPASGRIRRPACPPQNRAPGQCRANGGLLGGKDPTGRFLCLHLAPARPNEIRTERAGACIGDILNAGQRLQTLRRWPSAPPRPRRQPS
jgi:hypothetical protein